MLPITSLENEQLLLLPLQSGDWQRLKQLAGDASLWDFFPHDLSNEERFANWMEKRVSLRAEGKWYPFIVLEKATQQCVGLTCYLNVDEANLNLEIGGTWYGTAFHGTAINPNAKWLLLHNAFDTLGYERVEFKTDVLNMRSRRAIEKLGARYEGIFRSNRIVRAGRRRDTVYYSILKKEWPAVKTQLEKRMNS